MKIVLLIMQLPTALMVLYLDILSVAAVLWRNAPPETVTRRRFALLIPAHNEEQLLPRLLETIAGLDYPDNLYDVHVVADNCTDRTAEVTQLAGAIVHERHDESLRGKGYALRWLLGDLQRLGMAYDGYIIVDADSVLSSNFLEVMNRHLARGDQAVQSYYGVLNAEESWATGLRYIGLALYNGLRPRGRDTLGLSAGLHGNGMCFSSQIIEQFGWEAFTLAEDVEFHLDLVNAGVRVRYAAETSVLAEMPTSLRQAQTQNVRWERGRLEMLRRLGLPRLWSAARHRNFKQLAAVFEQCIPPFSVLTLLTVLGAIVAFPFRRSAARKLGLSLLAGEVGYILTGLRVVQARRGTYLLLLRTPVYVLWKLTIYARAFAHTSNGHWIRTPRTSDDR